MKPKLNQKIYIIIGFDEGIDSDKVGYLGETSFIIENYADYECSVEFDYDAYGVTWFYTLKEAKDRMAEVYGSNTKFKKMEDCYGGSDWWEIIKEEA